MHVILGATGNIGTVLTEKLLSAGAKVRAVARSRDKLKELEARGAEPAPGEVSDPDFLAGAFAGAETVFAMIPPTWNAPDILAWQHKVGESIVQALRGSKVTHVVNLSSIGADMKEGSGPVLGLRHQEEHLNALEGPHVLHLRPCYFMENLLANIELVRSQGIMGSPLRGDMPFAMIATRDVGSYAADRLLAKNFSGTSVRSLLGPRDVTMEEAAAAIGKAIGKPDLRYVQFGYDDARHAMLGMGLSESMANALIEMQRSMNEGKMRAEARDAEATTPTTIGEFAETVFKSVYGRA